MRNVPAITEMMSTITKAADNVLICDTHIIIG
jgi:hypothetical protein